MWLLKYSGYITHIQLDIQRVNLHLQHHKTPPACLHTYGICTYYNFLLLFDKTGFQLIKVTKLPGNRIQEY